MTIFDNDVTNFYCIGCEREGLMEEGAMCETCGAKTCAEHIEMIDRNHIRPKYWKCPTCNLKTEHGLKVVEKEADE